MGVITEPAFASSRAVATRPTEYLSFKVGAEEYGIDILRVQEIRGCDAVTRIAHAPQFIRGVINLRGVIVPIVDLRIKFALGQARVDTFTVVIILNVARRTLGIVVDSVSDVLQLSAEQIRPAPQFSSQVDVKHIVGLGTVPAGADAADERMLIIVDIERLMTSADMALVDSRSGMDAAAP
jgi:purine-binding chemotaxis protein CheW